MMNNIMNTCLSNFRSIIVSRKFRKQVKIVNLVPSKYLFKICVLILFDKRIERAVHSSM